MNTTSIILRGASVGSRDGADLADLCARCPMEANISLLIERAPDFFALCRARGAGYTVVAEAGSEIVGCVSVAYRSAWVKRQPTRVAYVADLRVAPRLRKLGLARRLIERVADEAAKDPECPHLFATAAGNARVDSVVERVAESLHVEMLSDIIGFQVFPLARQKIAPAIDIACPEERDRADLIAFCDEYGGSRELFPVMSDGGLDELLSRSPGMSLGDYLVARRRGRMVAVLGTWDAHEVKRTRVLSMPVPLRAFAGSVRALSRFLSVPSLPGQGDLLRVRYVRQFAVADGETAALAALVRFALNDARARGDQLLLFSCSPNDRAQGSLEGLPRAKYRYRLLAAAADSRGALHLPPNGLCHDDAALA